MPLDLENGDEDLANATPSERRRAAQREADKSGEKPKTRTSRSKATSDAKVETELDSRLGRTFDRIAVALEQRGDDELASVVREDAGAMAQGLVSLTRSVKFLRSPLLMSLNLIEPILAFGRVGRIMYVRFLERQSRIAAERAQAQEAETNVSPLAATQ